MGRPGRGGKRVGHVRCACPGSHVLIAADVGEAWHATAHGRGLIDIGALYQPIGIDENFSLTTHVQGVCMSLPFFWTEGTAQHHEESRPKASQTSR